MLLGRTAEVASDLTSRGDIRLGTGGMVRARRATRVNSGRARSSDSTTVKTGVTTEIEKKGHEQSWAARR